MAVANLNPFRIIALATSGRGRPEQARPWVLERRNAFGRPDPRCPIGWNGARQPPRGRGRSGFHDLPLLQRSSRCLGRRRRTASPGVAIALLPLLLPGSVQESRHGAGDPEPLRVELRESDPVLEGHGASRTIPHEVERGGTLHVFAISEEFDPFLRVESAEGTALGEDDDGGGGKTAFLALRVEAGASLRAIVASADSGGRGNARVTILEAPETPATLAAAKAGEEGIEEVRALRAKGDLDGARRGLEPVLDRLLSVPGGESSASISNVLHRLGGEAFGLAAIQASSRARKRVCDHRERFLPPDHPDLQAARENLAVAIRELGDLRGARALCEKVLEVRARTLPEDHRELQVARGNLAVILRDLGDLPGARSLEEKVLEVFSRTLPEDHPDLLVARQNLAVTLRDLGDLRRAAELLERIHEARSRTLPEDDPELQKSRQNLAVIWKDLGDLEGARALEEGVLEVRARTLPEDHPDLLAAQSNLAITRMRLGDLRGARALFERILEVRARALPEDHPDLQKARQNLAVVRQDLGDLRGARALFEEVLEVRTRTLPDDHPDLQSARLNVALTIKALGELRRARALEEKVLEVRTRTLPEDHPDLQSARGNLAGTLLALGDSRGARALFEKALEIRSRTLPEDHPDLQSARGNLAGALHALDDDRGARALFEEVLEVRTRTLPDDHSDLQSTRQGLAVTLYSLGDLRGALALFEKVFEVLSRTRPDDHPDLDVARGNLAVARKSVGDLRGARALEERVLEVRSRTLSDDHPHLQAARGNLAFTRARCGDREGTEDLLGALARGTMLAVGSGALVLSARETEAAAEQAGTATSTVLALSSGEGVLPRSDRLDALAFALVESVRAASVRAERMLRGAALRPDADALRREIEEARAEIARVSRGGADADALPVAVRRKERAERAMREALGSIPAVAPLLEEVGAEEIARALGPGEAAIGYWRYEKADLDRRDPSKGQGTPSLLAFVVRKGEGLRRVELGPVAAIEEAVGAWRDAIGAPLRRGVRIDPVMDVEGAAGERLRRLLLDPLGPALGEARRVIVALDDALHALPLEALPEGGGVVGDRLEILYRSALWELVAPPPGTLRETSLLAFGGLDYDAAREAPVSAAQAGDWERGFSLLPATRDEVERIAAFFRKTFPDSPPPNVLLDAAGTREALRALASRTRYLHLATHAYFAPESVPSTRDDRPIDARSGLGRFSRLEEQVRGLAPMVLCGLAFAGANGPEDGEGRVPGVMTAEEVAGLDLSGCDLAVLSACETHVGVRRAGQGIASLQRAVHAAGARSAVTSLWMLPDAVTRDLMVEFYRGVWVEKKTKAKALWDAKRKVRNRRSASGSPLHATWEWAGLVLTGES